MSEDLDYNYSHKRIFSREEM